MAKRKAQKRTKRARSTAEALKAASATKNRPLRETPPGSKGPSAASSCRKGAEGPESRQKAAAPQTAPRLDRVRRTLEETVPTPPSSLDMDRRGSAVRTGRAEVAQSLQQHKGMSPAITGGDVDVDVEDAYFTGDEAPGGDNPTPDQDIVDDIGKALGVEYQDNEELKAADKVAERDRKHRWELDPASSEDYKERKKIG